MCYTATKQYILVISYARKIDFMQLLTSAISLLQTRFYWKFYFYRDKDVTPFIFIDPKLSQWNLISRSNKLDSFNSILKSFPDFKTSKPVHWAHLLFSPRMWCWDLDSPAWWIRLSKNPVYMKACRTDTKKQLYLTTQVPAFEGFPLKSNWFLQTHSKIHRNY